MRQIRNISLIGFMGTGKSSVGRLVADQLHYTFLDTDAVIESRLGRTISDVFSQNGEAVFREWEKRIVGELETRNRTVIATGGGLPVFPGNLESLKTHSFVVCLWASPARIWERVSKQTHRPLLQSENPLEHIQKLLSERTPHYRKADILINTEFRSPREVATQVLYQLRMVQKS